MKPRRTTRLGDAALWLDLVERGVVLVFFLAFASRMLSRFSLLALQGPTSDTYTTIGAVLLVLSESLAAGLIVARPVGGQISSNPLDWALGFAGVSVPLLAHPVQAGSLPLWLSNWVMLGGLLLQISAKVSLWRSFGVVAAVRPVRTKGPYRVIRHPMYLGYSLTHAGFLIGYPSIYNAALYGSVLLIDISRLLREEQLLGADPAYAAYSHRVRYRLLPGVF